MHRCRIHGSVEVKNATFRDYDGIGAKISDSCSIDRNPESRAFSRVLARKKEEQHGGSLQLQTTAEPGSFIYTCYVQEC